MKKAYTLLFVFLCSGILSVKAQINDILTFNGLNGANPYSSLILSGKVLYGTATYGGANGPNGIVFAVDTNGTLFKQLVDFDSVDSARIQSNGADSALGARPNGSLVLAGNMLYGMTGLGGTYDDGVIYSVDTGGKNYKDLLNFNNANGTGPFGSLLLIGDKLYGMTSGGGIGSGTGTIFHIDTTGKNFKVIYEFDGITGNSPRSSLTLAGNKFYGTTDFGGPAGLGNIFSIDTTGNNYKDLLDFNGQSSLYGSRSVGDVIFLNGKLYGMTQFGGANNKGVIFSVDTSGNNYKDVLDFNGANGNSGEGDLLVVDSLFYGMTEDGGAAGDGNIFSIDTSGNTFTDLFDFDGTDGSFVNGSLILANNELFGTAYNGGKNSKGAVFSTHLSLNVATAFKTVNHSTVITIYPNPNDGYFTIDGIAVGQTIILYDYMGQILSQTIANSAAIHFDISDKASGVYLISIQNKDGSVATQQRVVKMN